jgi:hypothetical protein
MARLWTGRRPLVEMLMQVGGGVSPAFLMEAARLRGYRELRALRDRFRARRSGSPTAAVRRPAAGANRLF